MNIEPNNLYIRADIHGIHFAKTYDDFFTETPAEKKETIDEMTKMLNMTLKLHFEIND